MPCRNWNLNLKIIKFLISFFCINTMYCLRMRTDLPCLAAQMTAVPPSLSASLIDAPFSSRKFSVSVCPDRVDCNKLIYWIKIISIETIFTICSSPYCCGATVLVLMPKICGSLNKNFHNICMSKCSTPYYWSITIFVRTVNFGYSFNQ